MKYYQNIFMFKIMYYLFYLASTAASKSWGQRQILCVVMFIVVHRRSKSLKILPISYGFSKYFSGKQWKVYHFSSWAILFFSFPFFLVKFANNVKPCSGKEGFVEFRLEQLKWHDLTNVFLTLISLQSDFSGSLVIKRGQFLLG